jgi:lactate dehydrogenase-like 2-hydroxyacid dehydrogenase
MRRRTRRTRTKKKNVLLFFIVLILGIGAIGSILAYGAHVSANMPQHFVHERRHTAGRLYRETVGLDLDENYPQEPADLMELYARAFFLLHGNFIIDEDIFMDVIEFQRQLFTQELRDRNPAQYQLANHLANLEIFDEANAVLRPPTIERIRHDFYDQRTALAYVIHSFMAHENLYRVYHLMMDENDMWRINTWREANEYFEPIIN